MSPIAAMQGPGSCCQILFKFGVPNLIIEIIIKKYLNNVPHYDNISHLL